MPLKFLAELAYAVHVHVVLLHLQQTRQHTTAPSTGASSGASALKVRLCKRSQKGLREPVKGPDCYVLLVLYRAAPGTGSIMHSAFNFRCCPVQHQQI